MAKLDKQSSAYGRDHIKAGYLRQEVSVRQE
jgi:hypothetical protein